MQLFRTIDIVLFILLAATISFTYKIKYSSQKLIRQEKLIARQIEEEQNTISQLNTEWAYLTSPRYIAMLQQKFQAQLQLEPIKPQRILNIYEAEKFPLK